MSKTRMDYGSGVARPKIEEKDSFELKGQFLKELRENTFSGSDNEDANEHIEKVLEIIDLFHVLNITGEYDMWRLRIEQYFQVQDYALCPVTTKEKAQKKNDVKARKLMIVEQEVKGTASSSSSSNSHNMAFVSSPISTNEVNTSYGVSTTNTSVSPVSTQVSTANTQVSTANLSDVTVYAFFACQPNGSQHVYEDLEQIHEDDIEEMDLKWKLALLSMRTRRRPRNQDSINRNQDSSRRTINVEETSSKAMVAIDGVGFYWSYMADDEVPTNMALMAFLDSKFNKSEFNLTTYKRGLAYVKEQLVFCKKNELDKLKQEKESNQLKIENFDNASKSLEKLIGSQIPDKSRKGMGFVSYNDVPPPPTGLFSPLNLDLFNSGLEEFQQPEFEGYGPKTSKNVSEDTSNEVRESPDAPMVEKLVSDDKLEKKTVFPTITKIEFVRPKQ
ncbi:hypothetical protein Tco_1407785 [Tanacetum coccineum]